MDRMGKAERVFTIGMDERDALLEADFKGLNGDTYKVKSIKDPAYNCVAFAVGDTVNFWYDVAVNGYYWPPGTPSADTLDGWLKLFADLGYIETESDNLEPAYEKIAIYGTADTPEHVARQKANGAWVSKMGKGHDIEHANLRALEGAIIGTVVKIMKRKCKDGRRVLE
jgi:hypothetical protein